MILVPHKVLMLSQSEEPHRIFDHDAQPARTDHHTQTGHLPRRQTQGHDVQRALRAQRAGRTSCRQARAARELQDDVRNFLGRARERAREQPAC